MIDNIHQPCCCFSLGGIEHNFKFATGQNHPPTRSLTTHLIITIPSCRNHHDHDPEDYISILHAYPLDAATNISRTLDSEVRYLRWVGNQRQPKKKTPNARHPRHAYLSFPAQRASTINMGWSNAIVTRVNRCCTYPFPAPPSWTVDACIHVHTSSPGVGASVKPSQPPRPPGLHLAATQNGKPEGVWERRPCGHQGRSGHLETDTGGTNKYIVCT